MNHGFFALVRALVIRPLLRETIRTILTIVGIAVGVAVLVAIQLSSESALRAFRESVDSVAGRANYQIIADSALSEDLLLQLQPLWMLGGRFAPVIDLDGLVEASQLPIRILAVDLLSDLHFRDYRYARIAMDPAQAEPAAGSIARYQALFRPDSVVLSERFAAEQNLKIGSRLTIAAAGSRATLVVRGTLGAEGPANALGGSVAILDLATAQSAFGMIGKISRIDLLIDENEASLAVVRRILPPSARLERPARRNERVGKMLRAFRANLFALGAVALLVGIFLVYNTVLISILRRRRDVGIFKTLGVGSRQIFLAFVAEGAVLGVVGSALGVALGYALAFSALELIARTINSLYVSTSPVAIHLTPGLTLLAIVAGTGVSILSALAPALEASSEPPHGLIRAGLYQRLTRHLTGRLAVAAIACLLAALPMCFVPPWRGLPIGGYVAVLLVVAGFSLLAPMTVTRASAGLRPLLERLFGMPGRLAAVSLPASLRRTAVAAAALAVAIGMMVAVALMVGSFRETVRVWVAQTVRSDLWLRPARGLSNAPTAVFPAAILDDLKRIELIRAVDPIRGRDVVYEESLITVGSGDFESVSAEGDLPMVRPRSAKEAFTRALRTNGVFISESFAFKFNKDVGDAVMLTTAKGPKSFPIAGIYRDYSNDRGVVVMDRRLYVAEFNDETINTIAVFLRDGVDPEKARVEIERRLGSTYLVFGSTNRTIRVEVMKIFDQTFLITWALLAVALAVAILGIVNTLSALILERSREFALLEVLGMSRRQIGGVIVLESALLGFTATVLGTATGYVLSLILIHVINRQSFGWTIELDPPMALIMGSLAATFLTTLVAGLVPAALANRTGLAAAVKV